MKKRLWAPVLLLVVAAIVSVVVLAQERKGAEYPDHERLLRETHAALKLAQGAGCTGPKGTMSFGLANSSATSVNSCVESITQGTAYIDFWTLDVPTGHTVKIETTSLLVYVTAIQDYNTGTVLASTLQCGYSQSDCSFTYTVPAGGTYVIGFASVNAYGPYALLATDLTAGGVPTPTVIPATPTPSPSGCYTSTTQLCLDGIYTVSVRWDTTDGRSGSGVPAVLTANTGYFWFFDPTNVELTIKVLDAHGINNHEWVFYGALSNVHYVITVKNTVTGAVRTYENPQGAQASVADTAAF
ncbi:MAG TPA: hypothetical protein VMN82_12220 [Thermoanaerobaculia bacterium]|nr:hypothetical protein [Thermoanaerobaculia bacterium]